MKIKHVWLAAMVLPMAAIADTGHPVSMWLAEGDTNRIYILGSVHLLRREDHPLPAVLETAYDDAEALLMELDMDDIDPVALQNLTMQFGLLGDDQTLRGLMGEDLYGKAAASASAMEIPLDMLARTEPWLAALTIEQLVLTRIGFNPLYGIEMHMAMKASQDEKPVTGLETVEEQLGFLDGLSIDAQNELLLQTLTESQDIETEMDGMIRAWRNGDMAYLEDNMLADMQRYPELYKAIVADRNERWVVEIEKLLDDKDDYLIIVGALHLIGVDGVPQLLEKKGIKIRQMHESL
jgi:hypothetical protein